MILQGKIGSVFNTDVRDIIPVAENLRVSDIVELRDGVGYGPLEAVILSVYSSPKCWTIRMGNEPVAIFGVGPDKEVPDFGIAWFLATEKWDREGKRDMRVFSQFFVDEMVREYLVIGNYIDRRNTASIRWLKFLGFEERFDVKGVSGDPFVYMALENN